MNRAKGVLASLRLANSRRVALLLRTQPLSSQVIQFSNLSPCPFSLFKPTCIYDFLNTHQKNFFSSKPNSIAELILCNDWSEELEHELRNSIPILTHETVIYVLRKLDKDPEKASEFFNWVCEKSRFKPSSAICSLMLRTFVNGGYMKEFWVTMRKMKEQGFYIDEETYITILGIFRKEKMASDAAALTHFYNRMVQDNAMDAIAKKVVNIVIGSEWDDVVGKELGELKISLSDNFVLRVLKELRGHPPKILRFFHWAGQGPSYEHSSITYNATVRVLARGDSIAEFWNMVEEMKTAGYEMDIDTYIKISRQFQKIRMMEDAVKLYELMMDGPYKPSIQDCILLLRTIAASSKPNLDLVFRVVRKYEATGHSLSKAAYDGIHRSLTRLGRFDEAEKIMEAMRNAGYEPDNITYSQLVFGLCKVMRLGEACKVLDEMEERGCLPDLKTWTILIQGCCSANELDKALLCFSKMMEKECNADADLLDVLVSAFLSQKRINGAYTFLVEMVNKARLRPWQDTYKNLIQKLLGERKLEEALELLRLMKKHNYPPFPEPFDAYISRFGTVEDAWEFLKVLSFKEYPSPSAYLRVFKSFFEEGRHSEAKDLLYKCPHHIRMHVDICKLFGSASSNKVTS
ncbi:pentatricopeptide repeat-containing protein At3g48250, chloroplastic [Malania oleifera]|uniref:pentatricopeptide repeat-containing protein At3g48250, chloroplastic n=1 Tax=Malania oleifera TaxID=397392 RepID=UPI0025ADC5FD|nr:pentatricopeptide repeat-containing protein At3g48250, chloroplastic [Malania oleifera]